MIVISPRVPGVLFCIVGVLYSWGYGYDRENPGPQCFHYEVFEHPNTEPGDQDPNRALSHYPHETIHERTGEIPELTEENEFLRKSPFFIS